MPFLINSWISPFVLEAAVGAASERAWMWRWAIGMWAIIYPGKSSLYGSDASRGRGAKHMIVESFSPVAELIV